ncbi:MAG TPA: DUF1257 domain-containing protein [Candidatus Ozemobacteraceae bacterium]|nr:DUF1257 domain-containing protein [Candidatus Ozemobacteraceae bacterium]
MSAFVVLVPVMASWPVFTAAAAAAGAALGLQIAKGLASSHAAQQQQEENAVDVAVPQSHALAGSIDEGESLTLRGNGFTVFFRKTGRGDCEMRVEGAAKSKEELETLGKQLLNKIAQQYAYQRVTAEMKKRGFQVVQEKVDEEQNIRLTVRRWK